MLRHRLWLTLRATWWRLGAFVMVLAVSGYLLKQCVGISEEERVAKVLMEAKAAIEMKQYGKLMRLISANYHDSTGATFSDVEDAIRSYMKNRDLAAKIDILAMVVYVQRSTAVADVRLRAALTTGEHSYPIEPIILTIFLQKEFLRWKIITVEGWQRSLEKLPISEFVQ